MRVALAQINTLIGDFAGNAARIREWTGRAADHGAALAVFPELTLNGYPPRDLLDSPEFVAEGEERLRELAVELRGGPVALVGFVEAVRNEGNGLYNSVAWLEDGRVQQVARKTLLPNYDVFDERRYFDPSPERGFLDWQRRRFGLSICEDLWNDPRFWPRRRYDLDPMDDFRRARCDWVLNASASPYEQGKPGLRRKMVAASARHHGVGVLLCNLVGGNDSLIFDGNSVAVDPEGRVLARGKAFEEDLILVALDAPATDVPEAERPAEDGEVFEALALGLRDYVRKTGFSRVVVGLSGGIDSSLTAVIAARALGPGNVLGVAMPSRFTSSMSDADAQALARNLGIDFDVVPIESVVAEFLRVLSPQFAGTPAGTAEENLQARVRGSILMAISNKHGHLVLNTGNKSELSVGYCTLYGDMVGALAVIGDLFKTQVYRLARWINRDGAVIPERVLARPPSAELRENQKDEDSLPPYADLDRVLRPMVIERVPAPELEARGNPPELIRQVRALLLRSEYKRRQVPPILKVSPTAFGVGWRFPIAHGWRP